ncbi:hypothetical protein [Sphingobium lactosutens]|uniref:hypothetical protein n=1 Tax=Sphingobium lactosutens TaxID=522773 RepID=UPI000C3A7998|nr:hypothetical protein [Sphingobium lactosutens]MBS50403.1 hypothetical protein [Sphingobium sp.]MCC4256464.1 hypothetical protein [Sphingobium lactosutens]MEC9016909.1 hypothetical protein [Pseudomonadota bacterium]
MGSLIRSFWIAAPLLMAAPLAAQETQQPSGGFSLPPSRPAPDPNRQGPELDVYRDPVTPRANPPVTAPSTTTPAVSAPPVTAPTVTPPRATVQPVPSTPRQQASPPRSQAPRTAPSTERDTSTRASPPSEPVEPEPQASPTPSNDAAPAPAPASPPAPAENAATPDVAREPPPAPAPQQEASALSWIIGVVVVLLAILGAILLQRRRQSTDAARAPAVPAPEPAAAPPPALPQPSTPPPAPTPAPADPASPPSDRPWITMDLVVNQARYSLMGVTVTYSLILHNRGTLAAQDVLVRGVIGNAGAQQQVLLQDFLAGQEGTPLHSVVTIAPGETQQLTGELRLTPDRIVPVAMGQRSLLIPLAAFDAAYRWGGVEGDDLPSGRTARAFIVGQEQEPPTDRLAPLRLDQGPRQYRRPAARAAAELAPA